MGCFSINFNEIIWSDKDLSKTRHEFVVPLYFPEDKQVVKGIREIAEKGGPQSADHTLNNVGVFIKWRQKLADANAKKAYFPELRDTIGKDRDQLNRTSRADRATQLQDTFFLNE